MSSLLQRLIEQGVTADVIAEVAVLVGKEAALDERRERDRQRKKEQRAREKEQTDQQTGHVTSQDTSDVTGQKEKVSPKEYISNPFPKEKHPPSPLRGVPPKPENPFPRLDCSPPDLWRDFLKNRKAKKLPNTATAHAKLVRDLAAMSARLDWPPGEVFRACVEKGWGAIYDPRDEQDKRNGKSGTNTGSAVIAALERVGGSKAGSSADGPKLGDGRAGQVPDPVRTIRHVGG